MMMLPISLIAALSIAIAIATTTLRPVQGWVPVARQTSGRHSHHGLLPQSYRVPASSSKLYLSSSTKSDDSTATTTTAASDDAKSKQPKREEIPYDYEVPEDAVIHIKPWAMRRLRELRLQQKSAASSDGTDDSYMVLRMGVRSGGCSGMSYVMDFANSDDAVADDDQVDTYEQDKIQCIVDAKSMLYLYGLELDYSPELIGGGFRFYNPNAEESCGCGSSFGV